jgi:hypothetical protein
MRRAKFYSGVITLAVITLSLLTASCMQSNSSSEGGAKAARDVASVSDGALPEVVVTAQRPGAATIAMSDRDGSAPAGISSTPGHH